MSKISRSGLNSRAESHGDAHFLSIASFCLVSSQFCNDFQRLGLASSNTTMRHGIFLEYCRSEHEDVVIGDGLFTRACQRGEGRGSSSVCIVPILHTNYPITAYDISEPACLK
jgi:hypothetical protein